jgi:hypothetical protein
MQSLKRCFLNKNRKMDNVQTHNICINVPSSQTSRSYLHLYMFCDRSEEFILKYFYTDTFTTDNQVVR